MWTNMIKKIAHHSACPLWFLTNEVQPRIQLQWGFIKCQNLISCRNYWFNLPRVPSCGATHTWHHRHRRSSWILHTLLGVWHRHLKGFGMLQGMVARLTFRGIKKCLGILGASQGLSLEKWAGPLLRNLIEQCLHGPSKCRACKLQISYQEEENGLFSSFFSSLPKRKGSCIVSMAKSSLLVTFQSLLCQRHKLLLLCTLPFLRISTCR